MKREIEALKNGSFDTVIIGGGIYGAALAREAATRGLKDRPSRNSRLLQWHLS
jgi:glycerol-3-phosphate dehydrogenase